jgi:endogenous inhibitor of DNA gyrase (YacG/DUF329 family)
MAEATFECAICGRSILYVGERPRMYPFCSPRCKLVDLGKWFREQYSIDRDLLPDDAAGLGEVRRPEAEA